MGWEDIKTYEIMTKQEFEKYLIDIGGLNRTYREYKGPIIEAGWFHIQEGWYEIVTNIIDELLSLGWNKRIAQVKEKFGGLRFYVETDDIPEGGWDVIDKYEKKSRSICEKCGGEGVLRSGKWLRTLCDEHSEGNPPFDSEKYNNLFGS